MPPPRDNATLERFVEEAAKALGIAIDPAWRPTIAEHLRRLLEAARGLRDRGEEPPGLRTPECYRLRGCQMVLPAGADWQEASREEQRS